MAKRAVRPPISDAPWLGKTALSQDISLTAVDLRNRYGHRVRLPGILPASGGATQLFTHPDDVRFILQENPSKFESLQGPGAEDFEQVTRGSIVSLTEDSEYGSWVNRLAVLAPDFKEEYLRRDFDELVELVDASLSEVAGQQVDVLSVVRRIVIRMMGVSLFGPDIRAHEDEICRAVADLRESFKKKHLRPLGRYRRYSNEKIDNGIETLESVAERMVYRRTKAPDRYDDSIVRWLKHLSVDAVKREVVGMLIAGFTTLSAGLTWMIVELSGRPLFKNELHDDASTGSGELMRSSWKEILRLYAPLPIFGREAREDIIVNGFDVLRGEKVLLSPFVTHRDPEFWRHPESFDPRRFIDGRSPENEFAYYPFGVGPHACLGRAMANVEAEAFITALASRFDVERVGGERPSVDTAVNLEPDRNVVVRLEER